MIDDVPYAIKRYIIGHKIFYYENLGMKISSKQFEDFKDCFGDVRLMEFFIQEEVWIVNDYF